ncbi:BZ3500_MvSof-1268-A1-R1_Chr1-1g01248 [Microbotryum saponariae]|uniref:BZ3500_MvSof-1268-A1-R1_Chr1-1g01248 protein n=1 Tax=Microbotryum saponariae TaxID=289078 RepID=A0A2X0KFM4_9BASI|nr:BZ3500_MvSof-1268-A1-R1_Chr1-1g01248 [Microbotryum saponariae]SCZ93781.1 BZ3501_MvSof-1269-A2-R1_Chr1-1g00844 [Microbotryum saponariae]
MQIFFFPTCTGRRLWGGTLVIEPGAVIGLCEPGRRGGRRLQRGSLLVLQHSARAPRLLY